MSVPSFGQIQYPIPPGWSEHVGPNGQPFYFNAAIDESTYVRPVQSFLTAQPVTAKKQEKPYLKTPIPGTDWLRVITSEGNVFYSHKIRKESVWIAPEELNEALEALQIQGTETFNQKPNSKNTDTKRKAEDLVGETVASKKAKIDNAEVEEEEESDEEDEEWQREAAEQLAAEAETERLRKEEEKKEAELEAQRAFTTAKIMMPQKVDLSLEEGKALFKTLLREKGINPLHPWDISLPKFVSDPRYVLLPSVAARREAFEEYCKERVRELRQSNVQKEKEASDPKEDFERLLKTEVTSTRASWTDFKRAWKKDRRFYGWGRDDREREKRFRDYLKELGENKRQAAQKAEVDFFAMLKDTEGIKDGNSWKEVKKGIHKDPRYDAVGSSSLREELFNTFLKGLNNGAHANVDSGKAMRREDDVKMSSQERKKKAVRDREEQVKAQKERVDATIEKAKMGSDREEGERVFMTMLTDAIRDPQATLDYSISQLKTDPRFTNSTLPLNQQIHLFHRHVGELRSKQMGNLHALFEVSAPSLANRFQDLPIDSVLGSAPVSRLGLDIDQVESEFRVWQRERSTAARKAFDEMLAENSFVDFWGRLGKMRDNQAGSSVVKMDDEDIGEATDDKVDMKALAKTVDIGEMEKVLKHDKRYGMFDHTPDQREGWIRDYISQLAAPKRSSDVARLRKIVINSLYSHQEIFLRELISNANDALEKLRLTALTDKSVWDGSDPLNITIKAVKDEDGKGGRLIISDTGIGMTPEELTANLGTLAKSGTTDFLAQAENKDATNTGNLIGAFGLGFYSSFLVADRVEVASMPPKTSNKPSPAQHVFSSSTDDSSFEVYEDPRGNTLGRGTEITLFLKNDASEYLDTAKLSALVNKHSAFSSSFPIYLLETWTEEVPDEEAAKVEEAAADPETTRTDTQETPEAESTASEDEAIVEEVDEKKEVPAPPPPVMKNVTQEKWSRLNAQAPLWARDPKEITDEEYHSFYTLFFKDFNKPLAWQHFSGESDGINFKGLLFLPTKLSEDYWQKPLEYKTKDVKLMVKRVFITSDLGDDALPQWASWVKVVIDADDLPLNVSRETLQSNKFMKQLKRLILKHMMGLFSRISEGDDKKLISDMQETYGSVLKLGAVEDIKNREKLIAMAQFHTNQRNETSFDQYLENKKKGQKQIFYLAELGKKPEDLAQSVFIEQLDARGYEVFLFTEPLDEIMVGHLRSWKNIQFQDVAKAGLKFGDEDLSPEEEKAQDKELEEKFKPLTEWLKTEAGDAVRNVVLSKRLVKSPVAIVAEQAGYTANVAKMMAASNAKGNRGGILHDWAMKAKLLEINPYSPLIEGLLRRVTDLPTDEDEKDVEAEEELKEIASILIDGALVRSGFEVPDNNRFFTRIDRVLRRSLGVSETAKGEAKVKPAPPVAPDDPEPEVPTEDGKPGVILSDELKDKVELTMEEIDDEGNPIVKHDEL
ncbi:Hsp90 protein-domain-containing protein [Crepidotus variabilis]|uniref:Hsp90 protein-domain-containing protein n=1 Tax=Crepidotus variabilis TaxID=179855 RepID=A0A9P6ESR5_9AGAR|nr:Hsp90 protein-domain-containing protein [Crepidotus variabilis]